jgi:hypothetical protein
VLEVSPEKINEAVKEETAVVIKEQVKVQAEVEKEEGHTVDKSASQELSEGQDDHEGVQDSPDSDKEGVEAPAEVPISSINETIEVEVEEVSTLTEEDEVRGSVIDEILALNDEYTIGDILSSVKLLDFFRTDLDECLEPDCDNPDTTLGYCRYHYIKNWNEIKKKQTILEEGTLQKLIEELVKKYSVKNLEIILNDLIDEKSFFAILKELNIVADDSFDELMEDDGDDDHDINFETKGISNKIHFEE